MAFFAVLSALSTVASISSAQKSKKNQKRANEAQKKINEFRRRQQKRQYLRDYRAAQAVAISSSIVGGVDIESSRVQQTLGSQRTQAGTASREFAMEEKMGADVTAFRNKAASASALSSQFGSLAGFASSFASFGGGTTDSRRLPGDDSGAVTSEPSIFNVGK